MIEKGFFFFINFVWGICKAIFAVPYYFFVILGAVLGFFKEYLPARIKHVSDVI